MKRSIDKYGVDNFEITEKIDIAYTEEELNQMEKFYIKKYKSNNPKYGYNKTSGGQSGYKLSEDTKRKISESKETKEVYQYDKKGNLVKKYDFITGVEMYGYSASSVSACCLKKNKTHYGFVWNHTPMTKEDVLERIKYVPHTSSKQVYQYTKDGELVKIHESCNKVEEHGYLVNSVQKCCVGKIHTAHGFVWSYDELSKEQVLEKIENIKGDNVKKEIYQYDLNGELKKIYPSILDTKKYGFEPKNISACCNGRLKTVSGYIWVDREMTKDEILNIVKNRKDNTPKSVYKYTKDGKFVKKYDKMQDVKDDGYSVPNVCACCKGRKKSCGGYVWYYDKQE